MSLETEILHLIYSLRSPVINEIMVTATLLGSSVFIVILLTGIYLSGEKKLAKLGLIASILDGAVIYSLKLLIDRPRPELIEYLVPTVTNYAFPSGHTSTAFAVAAVLAAEKTGMKYFFYSLAVLVGISRLFLGVHYPSDVIIGGLIGLGIGNTVVRSKKIRSFVENPLSRISNS